MYRDPYVTLLLSSAIEPTGSISMAVCVGSSDRFGAKCSVFFPIGSPTLIADYRVGWNLKESDASAQYVTARHRSVEDGNICQRAAGWYQFQSRQDERDEANDYQGHEENADKSVAP